MDKATYVQRVTAICKVAVERRNALQAPMLDAGSSGSPQQEADGLRKQASLFEDTVSKLRALPPPEGDAATVEAIYVRFDQMAALARQGADAIEAGNDTEFQRFTQQAPNAGIALSTAMGAYGLPGDC